MVKLAHPAAGAAFSPTLRKKDKNIAIDICFAPVSECGSSFVGPEISNLFFIFFICSWALGASLRVAC